MCHICYLFFCFKQGDIESILYFAHDNIVIYSLQFSTHASHSSSTFARLAMLKYAVGRTSPSSRRTGWLRPPAARRPLAVAPDGCLVALHCTLAAVLEVLLVVVFGIVKLLRVHTQNQNRKTTSAHVHITFLPHRTSVQSKPLPFKMKVCSGSPSYHLRSML